MIGVPKSSPTSFSSVTTNVAVSPQNLLTFNLNTFCHTGVKFQVQTTLQKKLFFWSNPYKIEVIITSLIERLELQNFGHMPKSTIQFEPRDKILFVTSWTGIMMS